MNKKSRKMSKQDVSSIVADLDRWAIGQFGPKLTWQMLEDRFGFSRQSLQAKPEIKSAYDFAKKSLSTNLVGSRDQVYKTTNELQHEIEKLRFEISEYRRREAMWKERWQRIAFHIRQSGSQVHRIDSPIPENSKKPSEPEVARILGFFETEIPSTGRI